MPGIDNYSGNWSSLLHSQELKISSKVYCFCLIKTKREFPFPDVMAAVSRTFKKIRRNVIFYRLHILLSVYVRCKTVNTCALCRSFVSSSIVSGRIIAFICFILYDVTGYRFKLNMSPFEGPLSIRSCVRDGHHINFSDVPYEFEISFYRIFVHML